MIGDLDASTFPPIAVPDEAAAVPRRSFLGRGRALAGGLARRTLDLVYPPACLACGAATAEPGRLCAACWRKVRFIERPYCERLGTPFDRDFGGPLLSPEAVA